MYLILLFSFSLKNLSNEVIDLSITRTSAPHSDKALQTSKPINPGPIKKTFFRNYYFTLDELIYYHKEDKFNDVYFNLKKKISILILKTLFNLMIFNFIKSTKCFSRILAFYNFKIKYINKN